MTVAELKAFLSSSLDFTVVDVREPSEWQALHIANQTRRMLLLPSTSGVLRNDTADGWRRIPPTHPVFFICRSGSRSEAASEFLAETSHYGVVINVLGGMNEFAAAFPGDVTSGPYAGDPLYPLPPSKLGTVWAVNSVQLKQWLERRVNVTVVDVRSPAAFAAARVADAYGLGVGRRLFNIPRSDLLDGRWREVPRDLPIVVACSVTELGLAAAEKLAQERVQAQIMNVQGGMLDWIRIGLPTSPPKA